MFRTFTQLPYNEKNLFFRIYQNLLICTSDKKKLCKFKEKHLIVRWKPQLNIFEHFGLLIDI